MEPKKHASADVFASGLSTGPSIDHAPLVASVARFCDLGADNPSCVGWNAPWEGSRYLWGFYMTWIVVRSLSKSLVKIEHFC